jgi:hypothetical protein
MEAISSSETSVHTRFTRRHIPEDGILHSHRRENLKSYTVLIQFLAVGWDSARSASRPLFGLLCQPWMVDDDECGAVSGMRIGRGNRSIGENLPQCHFVQHKSHMIRPGLEPGPPQWEAGRRLTVWAMARPLFCVYCYRIQAVCLVHIRIPTFTLAFLLVYSCGLWWPFWVLNYCSGESVFIVPWFCVHPWLDFFVMLDGCSIF